MIKADDQNYKDFEETWEIYLEDTAEDIPDVTLADAIDEYGSGYFDGFRGSTIRELYDFNYSDDLTIMTTQGWCVEWVGTHDTLNAYFFDHSSADSTDSWIFVIDTETHEAAYLNF